MSIFEPLFLLLALLTLVFLARAALAALRGRFEVARRTGLRILAGASAYFGLAAIVSIASPRRVLGVGDPQCFDDWCITVPDVQRAPAGTGRRYDVTLRLASRARRAPQRERGTVVYLVDAAGRRYDPLPAPGEAGLDTLLQPGESVLTRRSFELPADATEVGLVYTHEGGFPIRWFVIGEGGWFAHEPLVRFPD